MVFSSEDNQKQGREFAQEATMTDETHIRLWCPVKFAGKDPAEFEGFEWNCNFGGILTVCKTLLPLLFFRFTRPTVEENADLHRPESVAYSVAFKSQKSQTQNWIFVYILSGHSVAFWIVRTQKLNK